MNTNYETAGIDDVAPLTRISHTPGPWTTGDFDWHVIVGPHTRFLTDGESGRHLSAVTVVDRSDDTDEDLANARLIAAAPELLAALKNLLAGPSWPGAQMTARAAIAKAEGK